VAKPELAAEAVITNYSGPMKPTGYLGFPRNALTYETFLGAVHSDDRQYVDQKWTAALQGEPYDIEHRIIVAGAIKWYVRRPSWNSAPGRCSEIWDSPDITERKRAEKALRQSEAQLRTIFDNLTEGVIVPPGWSSFDLEPAAMEMHGYSSLDEVRRPLAEFTDTLNS